MMKRNSTRNRAVAALVVFGILLAVGMPAQALAARKTGTTAAPFLTIGVGARPMAMGGAFVAMTGDANSLYWNPASIAMMANNEVILQHSTWLADMNYDFVGGVFSMGVSGAVGFSATMLNVGEMEVTTESYQEGTGLFFDSYSLAASGTYSYRFYDRFSIGANVKYIRETIWNETADGFAIDIGTLLITPLKGIRLGMNISNFGSKLQMTGRDLLFLNDPDEDITGNNPNIPSSYDTDQWKLPLTLRLGLAGEVFQTSMYRWTIAGDWIVPNDNSEALNLGTEFAFREMFMLRAGLKGLRAGEYKGEFHFFQPDNAGGVTFGAGLSIQLSGVKLKTDYAYESFDRFGSVQKYSLGFTF